MNETLRNGAEPPRLFPATDAVPLGGVRACTIEVEGSDKKTDSCKGKSKSIKTMGEQQ